MGHGFADGLGKTLGCLAVLILLVGCLLGWGVSALAHRYRVHASVERVQS